MTPLTKQKQVVGLIAFGLLLVSVAACGQLGDNGAAKPASVTIDSSIATAPDLPAAGRTYERALAGSILPDEPSTTPVTLGPSDATETENYQAAGWWLGYEGNSPGKRSRFTADYERFASGVLVLRLDTLHVRDQEQPPFHSAPADSIAVRGLRRTERLATRCRLGGYQVDERVLGLMPDSSSEQWMTPRRAWFIDTVASRFRRMRPDALACWLRPNPD